MATAAATAAAPVGVPAPPDVTPRATHRLLVMRGLAPEEAANLTAYLHGLPVSRHTWTLREISSLLFLRQTARREGWDH